MDRRSFLANFLIWILAAIFGYRIGNLNSHDAQSIIDSESTITEQLQQIDKILTDSTSNLIERGINVKHPPHPLKPAKADGVSDDTEALRAIFEYAQEQHTKVIIPGICVISEELEIKSPIIIEGVSAGAGYGNEALLNYQQISGILVKGTGKKRIRTRRNYRSNSKDPQDNPLSVALNIQADNVVIKDLSIFLSFDKNNKSPQNYGAKWDIGIFVGTRTNFVLDNVHILGYFREASLYFDVTHSTNLPRFSSLNGQSYDNSNNTSGGDGCTLYKPFIKGGKWGVFVAGAIKPDEENSKYYDEITKKSVSDWRGSFGFSDFTIFGGQIYGTDHHSFYRRDEATGDYLKDTAGGCLYIDGFANNRNQSVQGMRFFSTRFASFEPFRIRLDRANRIMFYGCHIEMRSNNNVKQPNGSDVEFNSGDTYGPISCTENTNNLFTEGLPSKIDLKFIPSSVQFDNFSTVGDSEGNRSTRRMNASGFGSTSGHLDLRSADDSSSIRFRFGENASAQLDKTGFKFLSTINNPCITSTSGELDLRASEESLIRFRIGDSSLALFDNTAFRPATDSKTNLGSPSQRFKQVFSQNGSINTSDRRAKQDIKPINDKVLDAWSEIEYSQFKFKDAVNAKGKDARIHFGLIAQEIESTFKQHGLNAFDYGILCYDEWDNSYEEVDEKTKVLDEETGEEYLTHTETGEKQIVRKAGNIYSIRPNECLMLEAALMRRTIKRMDKLLK